MCRHLAYLGRPRTLRELVCDPPHSLYRQSFAPRRQRHGTVNADGFGVGWYAGSDAEPARYRSDRPIWSDASFAEIARVTSTGAILAAVRDATAGMPYGPEAVAPFRQAGRLFSHNGRLGDWPSCVDKLAAGLAPRELVGSAAITDSALLWSLVAGRIERGEAVPEAVRAVVLRAAEVPGSRLNLLVIDGTSIVATACGDTLCWRSDGDGVLVASEPHDDALGWHDVPDGSLLLATARGVDVAPLRSPPPRRWGVT
ncbi:MAG TPA: ergothioneine biosynthesis protein EgtC [Mycobacteriales bacterium]|nr:ergothioneine biosynthesis protein EgtC [Mycobacteriales bacterium]